ncbi:MAG: hypothetical protein REH79_00005 [Spiroplasma sp.]|nr:hypothetical protein [Spiroplasma sp.]
MIKKNLTSIFLNKNWILSETPKAIAIVAPKNYFIKQNDVKVAIWFSKSSVFNAIKYQNRVIVWIDFEKEYQIISTDKNNIEIEKTIILGKDLHQQLKTTINEIKDSYLANKKKIS